MYHILCNISDTSVCATGVIEHCAIQHVTLSDIHFTALCNIILTPAL